MWPRSRNGKESSQTRLNPEPGAPVLQTAARHLGVFAVLRLSAVESDQRVADVWAFNQLRIDTHSLMRAEYAQRVANNPMPTAREVSLGMYAENLEPQVREATLTVRKKGYETSASGFFHGDITWRTIGIEGEDVPHGTYEPTLNPINKRAQVMDFALGFELDEATINGLASVGAEVVLHPADSLIHRIGFVPETPDINAIAAQWDTVASTLPDTGTPMPAAETFSFGFADWGATDS